MKQTILRLLLVMAVGLSAAACSQDWERPDSDPDAEEVVVTFSISAESGMVSTRAGATQWSISDGTQIDKLVYAVYVANKDEDGTYTYRLLEHYGQGVVGFNEGDKAGPGQTVMKTDKLLHEGGETITLRLMRGQEYLIAFWAQNSSCTAYDTEDLKAVVVDYTAGEGALAPNNDETRDAFFKADMFTAQPNESARTVTLKRAVAQINVGTAGWDYNEEADRFENKYAYSKIELEGLCDRLNVLTGEVDATGEGETVEENKKIVIYNWAKLPAYIHKGGTTWDEWYEASYDDDEEEYLWVDLTLNNDNPTEEEMNKYQKHNERYYLKYLTEEPERGTEAITTEVFKYLSMCYVLTGEKQAVINKVTFYLAETADGKVGGTDTERRFLISNVPIQRNWRTNILGGTRGSETTLFDPKTISLWVDLCPGFNGEHNYNDQMNGDVEDKEHNEYPSQPSVE